MKRLFAFIMAILPFIALVGCSASIGTPPTTSSTTYTTPAVSSTTYAAPAVTQTTVTQSNY